MEYWADHLSPSSTCRCDAAADLTLEVSWTRYFINISTTIMTEDNLQQEGEEEEEEEDGVGIV